MTAFEDFASLELSRRRPFITVDISGFDGDPNDGGAPAILKDAPVGTWYLQETPSLTVHQKLTTGVTTWTEAITPGGVDTNLQYNNAGKLDGASGLRWDGSVFSVGVAGFFDFNVRKSSAGVIVKVDIANTNNAAGSDAAIGATAFGGEAFLSLVNVDAGAKAWTIGVDRSVGHNLLIGAATSVGSNLVMALDFVNRTVGIGPTATTATTTRS